MSDSEIRRAANAAHRELYVANCHLSDILSGKAHTDDQILAALSAVDNCASAADQLCQHIRSLVMERRAYNDERRMSNQALAEKFGVHREYSCEQCNATFTVIHKTHEHRQSMCSFCGMKLKVGCQARRGQR